MIFTVVVVVVAVVGVDSVLGWCHYERHPSTLACRSRRGGCCRRRLGCGGPGSLPIALVSRLQPSVVIVVVVVIGSVDSVLGWCHCERHPSTLACRPSRRRRRLTCGGPGSWLISVALVSGLQTSVVIIVGGGGSVDSVLRRCHGERYPTTLACRWCLGCGSCLLTGSAIAVFQRAAVVIVGFGDIQPILRWCHGKCQLSTLAGGWCGGAITTAAARRCG